MLSLKESTLRFLDTHKVVIAILIFLQIVCYSFFFTGIVFTNHTFPNAFIYNFPSHKTLGEARWFADWLILLQGGSGVQPLQMFLAALLQAVNACLLAVIIGVRSKPHILMLGGALCLFPAFSDYYSFTMDHFTFVLGDTFILLGTLIFANSVNTINRVFGSAFLFVFALAAYQPKVSLLGLMAIIGILVRFNNAPDALPVRKFSLRVVIEMGCAIITAFLTYYLTAKMTIALGSGDRTHLNSLTEVITAVGSSFSKFIPPLTTGLGGIPPVINFIPLVGMICGAAVLLWALYQKNVYLAIGGACLLICMPIALNASHIINSNTWDNTGRINSALAYCFVFLCAYGLRSNATKWICGSVLIISVYCFGVLASQTANAAAFKTLYDVSMINRIVSRLEKFTGPYGSPPVPLVVAGSYPQCDTSRFIKFPTTAHQAHVFTDAFAPYRQVSIVNFFIGRNCFRAPTEEELNAVTAGMAGRPSWPSENAVYSDRGTVVLMLERAGANIPLTWSHQ